MSDFTTMPRRAFIQNAAAGSLGAAAVMGGLATIASAEESAPADYSSMFDMPMGRNTAEQMLDKANIRELVEYERYCRDYGHYDEMYDLYAEDSEVVVSWMTGTGKEFIDNTAAREGARSAVGGHKLFNTVVWLNGDKAVAESIAEIIARDHLGIDMEQHAHSRMLYRVERIDGVWKIMRFESVYEFDSIFKSFPVQFDEWDPAELDSMGYRESYKGICYLHTLLGSDTPQDLPGDDDPEGIAAMYQAASDWLFDRA